MGFGVFMHRSDSIYDDSPAEQYQFPSQYLGRVQACVGDWIVYCEPRKVAATRGYFAIAKVREVIPDPKAPGMYIAVIEAGSYLDFINPVPFNGPGGVIERGALNDEGRISGRAQSAVRPISPADFNRIISLGLDDAEPELPRVGDLEHPDPASGGEERGNLPLEFEQERERVAQLSSRIVPNRFFVGSFFTPTTNAAQSQA